jgi:peptide chain release factor subunit 3
MLCDLNSWARCGTVFEAEILVLELLEHKMLLTAGYQAVLHLHAIEEACVVDEVVCEINMVLKKKIRISHAKSNSRVIVRIRTENPISAENAKDFIQLARFSLRDEGKTIAFGRIMQIEEAY